MTTGEKAPLPRAWTTPAEAKDEHSDKEPEVAHDFDGNVKVSQKPPKPQDLERVASLPVLNSSNVSIPFRNLHTSTDGSPRRFLVIFIRHFFCGNCQEYLRTLCQSITPEALSALPIPTEIAIIGHGQPELIDFYAEVTSCRFPIYADPTKRLFKELGMTRTLNLGPKSPDYMQRSLLKVMLGGIYQGLTSGAKAFKGGDYWQVGGEFLLQDNETLWCHRMTNTRDHAEVPVLRKVVGLDEERPPLKKRWSVTNGAVRRSLSLRRQSWRKRSRSRSQERKGKEVNGAQDAIKEEDKENIPVAERSSEVSVQS